MFTEEALKSNIGKTVDLTWNFNRDEKIGTATIADFVDGKLMALCTIDEVALDEVLDRSMYAVVGGRMISCSTKGEEKDITEFELMEVAVTDQPVDKTLGPMKSLKPTPNIRVEVHGVSVIQPAALARIRSLAVDIADAREMDLPKVAILDMVNERFIIRGRRKSELRTMVEEKVDFPSDFEVIGVEVEGMAEGETLNHLVLR